MREFLSQKREQTQREREHRKSLVFKKMFIKKRKIQKRNIIFDKARITVIVKIELSKHASLVL